MADTAWRWSIHKMEWGVGIEGKAEAEGVAL